MQRGLATTVVLSALGMGSCLMSIDPLVDSKAAGTGGTSLGGDGSIEPDHAAGGSAGAPTDADAGCTPTITPGGAATHSIRALDSGSISIDGDCSEPIWANADTVAFNGQLQSSEAPTLRMFWDPKTGNVYGCLVVSDANLKALANTNDNPDIYFDDRLEYYLDGDTVPSLDPETVKVYINAAGNTMDAQFDSTGEQDSKYVSILGLAAKQNGTLNQEADTDVGWSAEWYAKVPFAPIVPGQLTRCEFFVAHEPEALSDVAFGTQINSLDTFGYCRFECPTE